MRRHARASLFTALATGAASAVLASASAAPVASADVQVLISARLVREGSIPPLFSNGATTTVSRRNFLAGVGVINAGPDSATVKVRFELPPGLGFGADGPDPSEDCTESQTPICQVALGNSPSNVANGWEWDVVAATTGSYVVKAEIVESSTPDPDLSDNAASVTFVVTEPAAGGGTGGGGSVAVSASAAKLTPARPKAGATVAATVRVTADGAPIRPSGVACGGTIGSAKLKGTARAASGTAVCVYRTPRTAKGKTLRGTISFTARATKFTKRFSVRLG